MSSHPNAILLAVLIPDDLSNKTHRAIIADAGLEHDDDRIVIGDIDYNHKVMESDYNEMYQITAPMGSIIIFSLVTYGYGEVIEWDTLQKHKEALAEWCKVTCEKHKCGSFKIYVTANYW